MYRYLTLTGTLLFLLTGCEGGAPDTDVVVQDTTPTAGPDIGREPPGGSDREEARGTFIDGEGNEIGTARLTQIGDEVQIQVDLEAIESGEYGFHIHETGTCEPPSFESAGGHYNPTDAAHGFDVPDGPHAGDLENLEVEGAEERVTAIRVTDRVSLADDAEATLFDSDGSALMIHSGPDDYTSQPSGDSGGRIACAEIEAA